jgi:tetratricopeptide (TPR) repeat protein
MGRRREKDGPQSIVEKLYPQVNAAAKRAYSEILRKFASDYPDTAWAKGVLIVNDEGTGGRNKYRYADDEDSLRYIKNLLELDALLGSKADTVSYLNTKDKDNSFRPKLNRRLETLRWKAEQYSGIVKNMEMCFESLLVDKDLMKSDLFEVDPGSMQGQAEELLKSQQENVSFLGLRALETLELIERNDRMPEADRLSQQAVLYMELDNIEKALEFSSKALEVDRTSGLAWMVKGYLAVKGYKQAFQDVIVHHELGTSGIAITSEEMFHQQQLEEASESAESNMHHATMFFLNAWRYWPERYLSYISNHYEYENQIIAKLFSYSRQDRKLNKDFFSEVAEQKFESLQSFARTPEHAYFLLTSILPFLQKVEADVAAGLAEMWMERVEASAEHSLCGDLYAEHEDTLLIAAGGCLSHMGILYKLFPFGVADSFCKKLRDRYSEAQRMQHLKSVCDSYSAALNDCLSHETPDYPNCLNICKAVLDELDFEDKPFDNRLNLQWKYMRLKAVVLNILKGFKQILSAPVEGSKDVAAFLLENVSPEDLQSLAGDDYFEKEFEDLGVGYDFEISVDLTEDQWHVIYSPLQGFLPEEQAMPFEKPIGLRLPSAVGEKSPVDHIISNLLLSDPLSTQQRNELEHLLRIVKELQATVKSDTIMGDDVVTFLEDEEEWERSWTQDD